MRTQLETFQLFVHYLKEVCNGADAYDRDYPLDEVARRFTFYTKNSMYELVCAFIDELGSVYNSISLNATQASRAIVACRDVCGIDLNANHGMGNILDVSAGGSTKYTVDSIIQETGSISYPTTSYTDYGNLRVHWGNITFYNSSAKFIIGCLYTWWIPLSLDMIKQSLALSIDKRLDLVVTFSNDAAGTFIYVGSDFGSNLHDPVTGNIRKSLNLFIPNWLIGLVQTNTYDGIVSYNGSNYLDKIVLFELSKLVCSANVKQYTTESQLRLGWFIEGIASCVTGEADSILPFVNICKNKNSIDKCIFFVGDMYPNNDSNSKYIGFMFFRYLAKKYSNFEFKTTQNSDILCERGEVLNYDELSKKIMQFFIKGNSKASEWELLDDDYNSFYGATIGIPIEHREVDTEFNKHITLIVDSCVLNFYDPLGDGKNRSNITNRLDVVLRNVFPNAQIDVVFNIKNRLQFVYDYITTRDLNTDYLIFNGLEYEYIITQSASVMENLIKAITSYCRGRNIITVAINTSYHANGGTVNLLDYYADLFDYYISLPQELGRKFGSSIFSKIVHSENVLSTVVYDQQYEPVLPARDNANFNYSDDNFGILFKKQYYNLLIRYVMDRVFHKGLFEVYLSFMYQNITNDSYAHWLRDMNDYMSEEYDHSTFDRVVMTKHGSGNRENAFRNTGEFISFGLHTSYDMNLWMCEQGDITCNYEEDKQINDIKLLQAHEFRQGKPTSAIDLPYYPTTGCPWITHSTQDMSNFNISATNKIVYYFVKYDCGGSITIRFHDGRRTQADAWQSIQFGVSNKFRGNLNMYIAGGNQALSPESWTYYEESHHEGLSYDLSIQNIALSNSNILTPTQLHGANMSNARVFSGGKWRDYYKCKQDYKTVRYFSFTKPPPIWGVPLEAPTSYGNTGLNKAFVDTYLVNKEQEDFFKSSVVLNPLYMTSVDTVDDKNSQVIFSHIPYAYSTNSLTFAEGINKIDGGYYLSVCNGWEDRLWWYKWRCGAVYMKPWQNRDVLDEMNLQYGELLQTKMQEKLVLEFNNEKLCDASNYLDIKSEYHRNVFLAIDIEASEPFDTIYFTGYKNLKNNYFTVVYNNKDCIDISKEDSDNDYVKTFNSDGTNKIHIEILFNDDVNSSIQICNYAEQYRNIHRHFIIDNNVTFVYPQDITRDLSLFNGICLTKMVQDPANPLQSYTKLIGMSTYRVTLGDIFLQATGAAPTYLFSHLFRDECSDSFLYVPCSDNYAQSVLLPKAPRFLSFTKVVFGNGLKDNLYIHTPKATTLYFPPTMNIIDFSSFDRNVCEIYMYSNSRLVFYNNAIYTSLQGYDISTFVAMVVSAKYAGLSRVYTIHVRQCVYDYVTIDYPETISVIVPDIV